MKSWLLLISCFFLSGSLTLLAQDVRVAPGNGSRQAVAPVAQNSPKPEVASLAAERLGFYRPAKSEKPQTYLPDYWDGWIYCRAKAGARLQTFDRADDPLRYYEDPYSLVAPKLKALYEAAGAVSVQRASRLPELSDWHVVRFENYAETGALLDGLRAAPQIAEAELKPIMRKFNRPNDLRPEQWHLPKINAEGAWALTTGSSSVVVAVVDDAVRTTHQDLQPVLWRNTGEIPGNNRDDDGNGYIDDVNGFDLAGGDGNPNPPAWAAWFGTLYHGTHCAGIAVGGTNDGRGVASIGWNTRLMAVKCSPDNSFTGAIPFAFEGVEYAVAAGADVVSMSWGGAGYSSFFNNMLAAARDRGIVLVAAAGNDNTSARSYPAAYNSVISVGASDQSDRRADFSNYGNTIDLMAPGVNILSAYATGDNRYAYLSGTSMACPLVAGAAALLVGRNPGMSPEEVRQCLRSGADNIDWLNGGFAGQLGAGRLNAGSAVQCAAQSQAQPPQPNFSASETSGCAPLNVQFTDLSAGGATSWAWDVNGDGRDDYFTKNPAHTYASPGSYAVRLTVTNGAGARQKTLFGYINVVSSVSVAISPAYVEVCKGESVTLSASGAETYIWAQNFRTSTGPTLTFSPETNTIVTLEGRAGSCVGSTTAQVVVSGGPELTLDAYDANAGNNGRIDARATGGRAPYDFRLGSGAYSSNWRFFNLAAGTYTVWARDASGCETSETVVVNGGQAVCATPGFASTTETTETTARLAWGATSGAWGYRLERREAGGAWTAQTVFGTSYILTGLRAGADYEWRVSAYCSGGETSAPTATQYFTTPGGETICETPSVFFSEIGQNTLRVNWNAVAGAVSYQIYSRQPGGAWNYAVSSGTSFLLTGLTPDAVYEIAVRTDCGGSLSEYAENTVQTAAQDNQPAGCALPQTINLTVGYNMAIATWAEAPDADTYTLSWRKQGAPNWTSLRVAKTLTQYRIYNLQPFATYEFKMRTDCRSDASDWSQEYYFRPGGSNRDDLEGEAEIGFAAYPNPSSGAFMINYEGEGQAAVFELANATGQIVWRGEAPATQGPQTFRAEARELPAGVYLLRLRQGAETRTQKMILQ